MSVNIIVALGNYLTEKGWPIGKDGKLPWHNSADLKWFKETTMGHPVIMGRKTWESIGKPLEGRINIIVTKDAKGCDIYKATSIEDAIKMAKSLSNDNDVFIIGGASIYDYALDHNLVNKIYIDFLAEEVPDADAFFPDVITDVNWTEVNGPIEVEKGKAYAFEFSRLNGKNNHVDEQYLNLVNEIIEHGEEKDTRAGKTHSLFSRQMRFNLKEGLPMLTTKKVFSKGVIHELLWFLKGDTNIKYLVDNGVHIWDDDAYRYYLELMQLNLNHNKKALAKEDFLTHLGESLFLKTKHDDTYTKYCYGDLNHVYGYQWTKWGGHNQIQEVIDTLKTNPDDRRMIVSAWNVEDIPDMALPPCHFCCQFYTKKMTLEDRHRKMYEMIPHLATHTLMTHEEYDKIGVPSRKLSCCFHMRSNDLGSGTSFNWLSYAILTHMIAQCVNMDVDELIYEVGDAHIYDNHIEPLKEQLKRNPHMYALPKLELNPEIKNINDFTYDDIKIVGYESYPAIKLPLNVGL